MAVTKVRLQQNGNVTITMTPETARAVWGVLHATGGLGRLRNGADSVCRAIQMIYKGTGLGPWINERDVAAVVGGCWLYDRQIDAEKYHGGKKWRDLNRFEYEIQSDLSPAEVRSAQERYLVAQANKPRIQNARLHRLVELEP